MQFAPWFRLPLRANERRKSAPRRNVQLLLVLVIVTAGLPFAFTPPAAANAVAASGCTIDPEKPKDMDGKLVAKARLQCSSALGGRTIRTDLQQRRADGSYYTVAKSIVVRDVPGVMTGQWYGANSDQVGGCKKVSGTRKFKSIIMITDGAGNIQQTASNPEDFNRDCVDASDPPLVALVRGSNSIEDCESVTEVLTDPDAEYTDPDVLFAQGNVEPCDGVVVTTYITAQADAEWTVAVLGIRDGLAGLPRERSAGGGTEITDSVPVTGNEAQDLAAISAKEEEVLDILSPDPDDSESDARAEVGAEQEGPCREGKIGHRRQVSFNSVNRDPAFGGRNNGPKFKTTVRYARISCAVWQITDVQTCRTRGEWPTRIDSATYQWARYPDYPVTIFDRKTHHYGCKLMEVGDTIGWDSPHDQDNWEIKPDKKFISGFHVKSSWPILSLDPWGCSPDSVHTVGAARLYGDSR